MNVRLYLSTMLAVGFFIVAGCLQAETLVSKEPEPQVEDPRTAGSQAETSQAQTAPEEEAAEGGFYEAVEVLQVEAISLAGDVQVKPRGGAYAPAEEGALLESGVTIKTGSGAYLELGFDEADENIVRIDENTTALLLLQTDEKIELLEGEVFSIINNLPGGASFEIRTPTAVAGARGTEWATRYKGETTDVEAYDDVPYVKSFDGTGKALGEAVDVKPGFVRSVRRLERPTEAVRLSDASRRRWNRVKQDLKGRVRDVRQKRGFPKRDPQKLRRFKAKAGKGDPSVQKLRERARQRPGAIGGKEPVDRASGNKDRAPDKEPGTFKERVERGDAWRERIGGYLDEAQQEALGREGPEGQESIGGGIQKKSLDQPGEDAGAKGPLRPRVNSGQAPKAPNRSAASNVSHV